MGNLRLYGSTSGYVEIAPPAVGGSQVLTLPTDSVQPGMVLVASQSFSAASSVSLNNVFTTTYENYRVVLTATGTNAGSEYVYARFRASGIDTSTNYSFGGYNDNTGGAARMLSTSQTAATIGVSANTNSTSVFDVISPRLAFRTLWLSNSSGWGTSSGGSLTINGVQFTDSQFDGITIYSASSTLTGTVRVFGYRN